MNQLINFFYNYCTDFVINLSNITNLSYYEVNIFIFCFAYPMLALGLPILYLIQKKKISKLKKLVN